MADWKQSTFGCFGNVKLCAITYVVAPIVVGAIAESTETDTMICGALKTFIPIYNLFYIRELRNKVAKSSGIEEESCGKYLMCMFCCGICTIAQTGNECGAFAMGESIDRQ